jgi:hypothetical protein
MSFDDLFRKDRPNQTLQIASSRLVAGDGPAALSGELAEIKNRQGIRSSILGGEPGREVDSYTVLIGPAYCDTKESMVNSVTPSTVACATKILSKGSL